MAIHCGNKLLTHVDSIGNKMAYFYKDDLQLFDCSKMTYALSIMFSNFTTPMMITSV